jgi:ligand-binding sensor domain-containing protein
VSAICRADDGSLWFGTRYGGVSRYDGKMFVNFTEKDGLAYNDVRAICCAPNGNLWFGTQNGVSRYDGEKFVTFRTEDGLAYNRMHNNAIHCTRMASYGLERKTVFQDMMEKSSPIFVTVKKD